MSKILFRKGIVSSMKKAGIFILLILTASVIFLQVLFKHPDNTNGIKENTVKTASVDKNNAKEKSNENELPKEIFENGTSFFSAGTTAFKEDKDIENIIANMSLREKICQMIIIKPEGLSGTKKVTETTSTIKNKLKSYPVGGVVFFSQNIISRKQISDFIKGVSEANKYPMFIAVDQEGGTISRLNENVGFPVFEDMYKYKNKGGETAYRNAKTMATEMKKIGFNLNFAPVADVWSNKENTVIGERAYSDNFKQAAGLVFNAVKGFNDGGIISTLKHFPGHGDTNTDTHHDLAYIGKSKEDLNNNEILPFKSGVAAGADLIMLGHLVIEDIDKENPATISKKVVTDYLKNELGYEGIIITDSLAMGAVANTYKQSELCVKAIDSGVDILLMPINIATTVHAIENAVKSGTITEERIDESVRKILFLKKKYAILEQ